MTPKPKIFRFAGHDFDPAKKELAFHYEITFVDRKPLRFSERLIFPELSKKHDSAVLAKCLDALELIIGISYYKLYCPPKIETKIKLSREQADFWNTVYRKGLGEFLYRNNLDPKRLAKFPYVKISPTFTRPARLAVKERALLGIGGGKDSIVAAELLKHADFSPFLVETQKEDDVSRGVIKEIGRPSVFIRRELDPRLFEKHEGGYNGHIPISAIFAFIGLLTAALYDYKYVAVGNEASSNFGNIEYKKEMVNHQWSKSAEFESMLQEYTRKFITPDITYFSLLRQFYEIRIAELFAKHGKNYFFLFSSCNRNFRVFKDRPDTLWCGECPKCAFVFLMLAPFLSKNELLGIFKKNLFADETLVPLFADVLGFGTMKPFDCVGTFEEARAAVFLASQKYSEDVIVKKFLPKITKETKIKEQAKNQNKLVEKVFRTVSAPTLPTPFRFLGIKNVAIIGYGREGVTTEKYIKKMYPDVKIGILDQARDKNYLKKQVGYDLAVKTPGIPKTKITIPHTTATNLFFANNKNITIGVTGTKGKSTTVSLMYEMLRAGGKKVRLIGNIGNPMLGVLLGVLLGKVDPKEIFVVELSSYMLDDIEYSPNVAVLLNLFPEHMNYHGSLENYYAAKKNIFKFQKPGDIALKPPFDFASIKIPIRKEDIPLRGEHNIQNIKVAATVARLFGVSDAAIKKAVKNFKSLPHRIQPIGTFKGKLGYISFFDDAISTTPESTALAIKALPKIGTIFLGGEDRGYDFRELEKVLRAKKIKNIVLFPDTGTRILKSRKGFNILETKNMEVAVKFAYEHTPPGSICLLSTASPSYSVWKNFEEKGDLFQKFVKKCGKK